MNADQLIDWLIETDDGREYLKDVRAVCPKGVWVSALRVDRGWEPFMYFHETFDPLWKPPAHITAVWVDAEYPRRAQPSCFYVNVYRDRAESFLTLDEANAEADGRLMIVTVTFSDDDALITLDPRQDPSINLGSLSNPLPTPPFTGAFVQNCRVIYDGTITRTEEV